jgi:protein-tyrosine kinase
MNVTVEERPNRPDAEPAQNGENGDSRLKVRVSRSILCLAQPQSDGAEVIRSLRTHLMAGHLAQGRRSLALCAPDEGVGTTFVAVNLAVAFAQAGLNTLLIDANLHSPGVDALIQPDEPVPGLRQMLEAGDNAGMNAIQPDVLPNLSVLYAGGTGSHSQELLAGKSFKRLIDECMRDHEVTIVDTPPTKEFSDARRIAKNLRYAMIVARRDATRVADIRGLAEEFESDRVTLIGTFLNDY